MRLRKYGHADVDGSFAHTSVRAKRQKSKCHLADSPCDFMGNHYGCHTGVLLAPVFVYHIPALAVYGGGVLCKQVDVGCPNEGFIL